jgi:outer membrane protein insertion porin family
MKRLVILTTLFLAASMLAAQEVSSPSDQQAAGQPAVPSGNAAPAPAGSAAPAEAPAATPAPAATAAPPAAPAATPAPAATAAPPAAPAATPAPAAPAADWFWGKPIGSVQWSGIVHADRRELDSATNPYIGKPFTEDLWMELQSKLYELDWFVSIDPSAIPVDNDKTKVIIKFTVVEKPAIEAVRVQGNSGLKSSDVLDAASEKAGDIYNQAKSRVDEIAVRRLYLEKGYPDATVSSGTAPGKAKNTVVLTFRVVEGGQVTVHEIRFSGNTAVSSQTLKGKMSLKESGFLQPGVFQESKLEDDKKSILDYYQSRGYVDASIDDVVRSYDKDPKTLKSSLILTVSIKEGKQWLFGGISFEGNTIFSSDKLASYVADKPGTLLNYKKLMQEKSKIDDLYYESGYIFNEIKLEETRDQDKLTIAYKLKITEQDRAHIETITIKGNKKTKDFVLYRELPLEVGDVFSKAKIMEGLRNLYNLQYFSAIDPQMFPGSAENLMNLVVSVAEQSTADVQFGVTLSGITGDASQFPLSGLVKWDDKNFLGNGTDFSIEANASPTAQSLTFGYTDRYFFGNRFLGGVNLTFAHKTLTTGQDSIAPFFDDGVPDPFTAPIAGGYSIASIPAAYLMPYDDWEIDLAFSTGYTLRTPVGDLGFGGALSFGIGMKNYDETRYRAAYADIRDYLGEWRLGNKLIGKVSLNDLDLSYNPSRGYYLSERLTWAGLLPAPLESQQYFKTESKIEAYATLFSLPVFENWNLKWVLGAHSGYQTLGAKPDSQLAVTDDWLYLDGVFNARGWKDLYGFQGVGLWENWVELRMPILEQYLWVDGFFDAAALQTQAGLVNMNPTNDPTTPAVDVTRPNFSYLAWNDVAMSVGFGVRFAIQQFPFRFYFAKRFVFDGSQIQMKTTSGFDLVISITQAL